MVSFVHRLPPLFAILWVAGGLFSCSSPHRTVSRSDTGQADTANTDTDTANTATAQDATAADATLSDASQADTLDPVDAADEGTHCFVGGPPPAGAKIKSPPLPNTSCPAYDKPFVGTHGDEMGSATLKVEIGWVDAKTSAFTPFENGEFRGIVPGAQPGFHVFVAFRVTIPGETGAQAQVEVGARGLRSCQAHGYGALPVFYANADPGVPNAYVFHHKLNPGFQLICQDTSVCLASEFCGQWYDVRMQVLHVASGKWGKGKALIRVWDGVTAP